MSVALRAAFVLLIAVLFTFPSSASPSTSQADVVHAAWDRFVGIARDLGLPLGNASTQNVTVADQTLELQPLGDIDHDGADDVLATLLPIKSPTGADAVTGKAQALSGRDLAKVLWNHDLKGAYEGIIGDVDGDGIADLGYAKAGAAQVSSTPVSVGYASAGKTTYTVPVREEIRSGLDGHTLIGRDGVFSYDATDAMAFAIAADAWVMDYTFILDGLSPMGNNTFVSLQQTLHHVFGFAYVAVAFVDTYGNADKLSMQALDDGGKPKGTVGTTGTFDNVLLAAPAHLDSKPGADLLVVVSEDAAPYSVYAAPAPLYLSGQASPIRVEAWSGADGAAVWTRAFDRQVAYERIALAVPLGDLDGDGFDDVEYLDAQMPTPLTIKEHFELLSGKDGKTMASRDLDNELYIALPFGDVNGDGKADMLFESATVSSTATAPAQIKLGVASGDLTEIWSMSLPTSSPLYVLNSLPRTMAKPVGGFADWTGDGAPDLVLTDASPYRYSNDPATVPLTVEVLDGTTGKQAWKQVVPDVWQWSVLDDVTGRGGQDLFVAQAKGVTGEYNVADLGNATVEGRLIAGESGQDFTATKLRSGAGPAFTSYAIRTLGDLDGSGGPEWGIRIEDRARNPHDYSASSDDPNDPSVRWLVFPGTPGAMPQLLQPAPEGKAGDGSASPILNAVEAPEAQDAARAVAARGDAQVSPGFEAAFVALGAALVLTSRKRRQA